MLPMKIGILTHYNVINNGAALQMYALKNWLEQKGHKVFILTYKKNFDYSEETAKKYNFSIKNLFFVFKSYFIKGSPALFFHKVTKHHVFRKFIKKNFTFLDYKEPLDAIVVGSDEVFSLEVGCNRMMYGHDVNTNLLISYAPSFGQTDYELIKKRGCEQTIISGLKKFDYLSVRDECSKQTLLKLAPFKCEVVCDPVILFDFSAVSSKIRMPKQKYILLYSYDKNMNKSEEVEPIKKYAKDNGFIIVSAGTYHKWCDKNIICNPVQWIELFRNAEEIITDTFHGAILSIITQKKALFLRQSINSNKLTSLITEFNLLDFLVDSIEYELLCKFHNQRYNKEQVYQLLLEKRKHGACYLEEALAQNHE